jgi:hypothetical protein
MKASMTGNFIDFMVVVNKLLFEHLSKLPTLEE